MFKSSVGQLSSLLVRVVHHATLQGKPITFASALAPATTPWIAMWLANMSFTRSYTIVGLSSLPSLGLLVQR